MIFSNPATAGTMDCIGCRSEYTWSSWIGLDWIIQLVDWVGLDLAKWNGVSAQLFRLECVKFVCDVSSSQRCRRAASSDSMRWSAMYGPPESSYCFSKSWHSSSKHGVYVGRKPRGMEWRASFCIAPQKRWYDSSTLMLLTGISGIERSVARV